MFDEFHDESKVVAGVLPVPVPSVISGRPGRAKRCARSSQHMKNAGGVWFATGSEVARWCIDEIFKADRAAPPLRVAAL